MTSHVSAAASAGPMRGSQDPRGAVIGRTGGGRVGESRVAVKKTKEERAAAKKTKERVGIHSRSARETLHTSQL